MTELESWNQHKHNNVRLNFVLRCRNGGREEQALRSRGLHEERSVRLRRREGALLRRPPSRRWGWGVGCGRGERSQNHKYILSRFRPHRGTQHRSPTINKPILLYVRTPAVTACFLFHVMSGFSFIFVDTRRSCCGSGACVFSFPTAACSIAFWHFGDKTRLRGTCSFVNIFNPSTAPSPVERIYWVVAFLAPSGKLQILCATTYTPKLRCKHLYKSREFPGVETAPVLAGCWFVITS